MSILEAVIQAVIQGLTEFLPVSSSGHLSLFQHFTGNSGEGALLFSAFLHLGTLVAVFIAFRDTIWALIKEFFAMLRDIFTGKFRWSTMNGERRMIIMLIISLSILIPFYIFKDVFTSISEDESIFMEGLCFIYTAVILIIADKCANGTKNPEDITTANAVTIGIFQGIALLPGVSRSGSTIASSLMCRLSRDTAVRYSFILGIPAIMGGCFLEITEAVKTDVSSIDIIPFLIGFVVAAVVGICAIKMVQWLLKTNKFKIFAIYTAILGVAVITIAIFEKTVDMNLVEFLKA